MPSHAVPPSTATVIWEDEVYLAFPAIARAGDRLIVIFSHRRGNPLDFDARLLISVSDDDGRTWSTPEVWVDERGADARNCGGGTLADGRAHFVFDLHGGNGKWRRTFFRTSSDGLTWSTPVGLKADVPERGDQQITSVGNRAIAWDDTGTLYFPHFIRHGNSVLVRPDGSQSQTHTVPRIEPVIARNARDELICFSKGGPVDISRDNGVTWEAITHLMTVSQPDLLQITAGRLLFGYSGKARIDEWLLLSKDGHDLESATPVRIFAGTNDGVLDSRGKMMCLEHGDEILSVLYEACGPRGNSRVYLVRTPQSALTR